MALGCYVNRNVQCQSAAECEAAGECSDAELLTDWSASPPAYGACIFPKILPIGDYLGVSQLPFCLSTGMIKKNFL